MTDIRRADPSHVCTGQRFLFDTNIWMDICYSDPERAQGYRAKTYSAVFSAIQAAGAEVLFNALVMSELINAIAKREFNRFKARTVRPGADFKRDFRNDPKEFSRVKALLRAIVTRQILPHVRSIGLPCFDLDEVYAAFDTRDADVNDVLLARCAEAEGCILVSHDADLGRLDAPITLWTVNDKLLMASA